MAFSCELRFKTFCLYFRHMERRHNPDYSFRPHASCPLCEKSFHVSTPFPVHHQCYRVSSVHWVPFDTQWTLDKHSINTWHSWLCEIDGVHYQFWWDRWCKLSVLVGLMVYMISFDWIDGVHYQFWWDWWCTLSVLVGLMVYVISFDVIDGVHYQFWWDWWCTLSVLMGLMVYMISFDGIDGVHDQFWWDWWCTLSVLVGLMVYIISFGGIDGVHYQFWWVWWCTWSVLVGLMVYIISFHILSSKKVDYSLLLVLGLSEIKMLRKLKFKLKKKQTDLFVLTWRLTWMQLRNFLNVGSKSSERASIQWSWWWYFAEVWWL